MPRAPPLISATLPVSLNARPPPAECGWISSFRPGVGSLAVGWRHGLGLGRLLASARYHPRRAPAAGAGAAASASSTARTIDSQHHLAREGVAIDESAPQRRPASARTAGRWPGDLRARSRGGSTPGITASVQTTWPSLRGSMVARWSHLNREGPGDLVAFHHPRQREVFHAGRQGGCREEAHPAGRPQTVERLAISFLAARAREPLQDVPVPVQEAFDQRGAVDRARHADHGGHAGHDFRVHGQGFEGVPPPLGVPEDEESLAGRQGHRHQRVAELARIVLAAPAPHTHTTSPR